MDVYWMHKYFSDFFNTVFYDCDVDICENEGLCKQLAGDYLCNCLPGFTGAQCQNKSMSYQYLSVF